MLNQIKTSTVSHKQGFICAFNQHSNSLLYLLGLFRLPQNGFHQAGAVLHEEEHLK
jgi:hypothetical protein